MFAKLFSEGNPVTFCSLKQDLLELTNPSMLSTVFGFSRSLETTATVRSQKKVTASVSLSLVYSLVHYKLTYSRKPGLDYTLDLHMNERGLFVLPGSTRGV